MLIALGIATLGAFAAAFLAQAPRGQQPVALRSRPFDPIAATLVHCQELGDGALSDVRCRAAWAEHRRRFLARAGRP